MKNLCVVFIACVCIFSSCIKETIDDIDSIKGVKAQPAFGLPLINSQIGMDQLVKDAASGGFSIDTDSSGKLILKFLGTDSLPNKQFVSFIPVKVDTQFGIPAAAIPAFISNGSFSRSVMMQKQVPVDNNERIERVLVKEGSLNITVTSQFKHNTTVRVVFPGLKKNGVVLSHTFDFIYNGAPQTLSRPASLAGYEMDLTNNGTSYNVIAYEIQMDITRNPANQVDVADMIRVNADLDLESYSRADGYFGKFEVISYQESQALTLFDKKLEGNVFIKEPLLRIVVANSIGMPIIGKFTEMYVETGSGNKVPIDIDQFRDTFSINYTTITGQSRITEYIIDKNNSNIEDILSSAPQKIVYTVSFTANADEQVKENVVTDQSTIKVTSTLELPLDLRILHYALEETGEFSLNETTSDLDTNQFQVQWAEMSTDIVNYLPLNAYIQVYFEDSVKVLDSLFSQEFPLSAAHVNASGAVVNARKEFTVTHIPREKYDRINKGSRYRLRIRLRTAEESGTLPFVTFYIDQKINFKMGIKTKFSYKSL